MASGLDTKYDDDTGFGLASFKQEGTSEIYDRPDIQPWPTCGDEFRAYFNAEYSGVPWPIKWYLKRVAQKVVGSSTTYCCSRG